MIQHIRGELLSVEEDRVIVDVHGFGLGIFMSMQSISCLPSVGQEVRLFTYLNVREDAMQLFGFLSKDDLNVFKLLIGVNGIGPKGGQAILSVLSPDDLRYAVLSNDVKAISAAPGVGKKTAEKLILELKDKLKIEDVLDPAAGEPDSRTQNEVTESIQKDALQALVALGYGSTEALRAIKKVEITSDMNVEQLLKLSLKYVM